MARSSDDGPPDEEMETDEDPEEAPVEDDRADDGRTPGTVTDRSSEDGDDAAEDVESGPSPTDDDPGPSVDETEMDPAIDSDTDETGGDETGAIGPEPLDEESPTAESTETADTDTSENGTVDPDTGSENDTRSDRDLEPSGPEVEPGDPDTETDTDADEPEAGPSPEADTTRKQASGATAVDIESVGDVDTPRNVDDLRESASKTDSVDEGQPIEDRHRAERVEDGAESEFAGEEVTPKKAERYAVVGVAGSIGLGVTIAVVGELLELTRQDALMILASGGLLLLVVIVFGLFRAMITTVEREGDAAREAFTHPLFMLLFLVLATAVSLFVGYLV